MVSSNKTLEDGETKLEAMRKKLVEARETLKTLNIDLEVTKELIGLKDNGLVELEKQLAAANDQIATHEDTIRQLQEALNRKSASLAPSERECTLDDRKLSAVRSLAFSILDVVGGEFCAFPFITSRMLPHYRVSNTSPAEIICHFLVATVDEGSNVCNRPSDSTEPDLPLAVLEALRPMFEERVVLMPKKGFPDEKHFGFKDGFFYPPKQDNPEGKLVLEQETIFVAEVSRLNFKSLERTRGSIHGVKGCFRIGVFFFSDNRLARIQASMTSSV